MRIGNWLGGSVIWALAATMSMAASARHRRARHDRPVGRFLGRAVRRSLFRRLRSDAVRRRAEGQDDRRDRSSSSRDPNGTP